SSGDDPMRRPLLFMLRCNPSKPIQARVFVSHDNITDIATYLRAHAVELGSRILETYPPLQSTKDPIAPPIASLLRKALPAQALAITGTAKYLRSAKAARIVAECGAGKAHFAIELDPVAAQCA
ncbi:MAG: hypothetical protein WBE72_12440, partial [Terracidiphilus sp.]